ncbi:hypothetical protein L1987_75426 [Smallanthus sonchifolius]|uniref:Uncharacterized protein n=1 Tax=Smallanthus sonchifolius TaxID=185202 RepID=A0ACB9A5S6_9ASTR|nr:hypothetical protein L1987_75426 [Smallanthus sonchifolius]
MDPPFLAVGAVAVDLLISDDLFPAYRIRARSEKIDLLTCTPFVPVISLNFQKEDGDLVAINLRASHGMLVESGPRVSVVSGIQRDGKGENYTETSASPNSSSHPQYDLMNSWDQPVKNNDDGVGTTGGQRLEKETSLGSSLDWKSLKWIRSGSLSSRGSGFSHLSSCKIIGVDSFETKMEVQQGNITLLQSPSGDAVTCLTPNTPDEANSRKKPRLGWGEGLAKYEKKKVDPDDIIDKENGSRNGMADGVSSSESLLPSPSSLPAKSPSLTGNSEIASPTTPCSFARSLSPGLEEKTSITTTTVDNDTCNPSVVLSQNHTQGLPFSLENLDLTEGFNLSLLLDNLLQTDDTSAKGSGFAMDKLQVWKADISKRLEITESEIDLLEHELKSDRDSCPSPPASSSLLKQCDNKNTEVLWNISSVEIPMRKDDVILEERVSPVNLDTRSEKAECSHDHVCMDGSQDLTGSSCKVSVGGDAYYDREDKLYDSILGPNKAIAGRASDELSKLLPTTHLCTSVLRATDDSEIKRKVHMRKRFLKFKERVTTLKFRTFQYSWKESLRLLSIRSGAKSQKKFESSFRMGYADHQKHRTSNHSHSSSSARRLSLVPTKEVFEYANMLLSDSRVKTCRNVVKMPIFILDRKERMSSRFISNNGLVENPIDVEKERSIVNPWTVEDTEIFLDKYALFGKNFRKIASFFQHKTVADCVEFYYKNHKSELFQKTKKKSEFAKGKSWNTNNMYLVTSGKRLNRETGANSLDMLGAASAMVANMDGSNLEQRSHDFAIYCNEQETAAADVLAGICRSISSEALGSCITSSVDHQKVGGSSKRRSLNDVDEETCSDDSCGEQRNSSVWTDEERSSFIKALRSYGKDFSMISRCMGTRSSDQCKLFFSKARKCLGLDVIDLGVGSESTTGANQGGGGSSGSDQDDTCMVDSGSGISHDKSSMECKMDAEESDLREEHAESDRNIVTDCRESDDCEAENKPGEKDSNGNLEGAADSEAVNMEESPQNTCSDSASVAKVEEADTVARASSDREGLRESEHVLPSTVKGSSYCPVDDGLSSVPYYSRVSCMDSTTDHGNNLDLNTASENFICQETRSNGFMMPNLFPQDAKRKSLTRDDASSRLTFRKSSQRSSSIDGYQLHKRSQSHDEPQSKLKLDECLLLPRDGCLQMGTDLTSDAQQQRRSSSLDIEKPSRTGDLKLFGKIITNHSLPKANGSSVAQEGERKLDYAFGGENNVQLKTSYGFWDGNRIQTGFSSLPGSAVLLAKYPAAFSNTSTLSKLDQNQLQHQQLHSSLGSGKEQCSNLNVVTGFQTRKLTNNCGPSYHAYSQPITVDKLLPELPRRKDIESLSTGVGVMNGGVSDPVAAIRLHFAKTEQYNNSGGESWRSSVSDIGSR